MRGVEIGPELRLIILTKFDAHRPSVVPDKYICGSVTEKHHSQVAVDMDGGNHAVWRARIPGNYIAIFSQKCIPDTEQVIINEPALIFLSDIQMQHRSVLHCEHV
jgi:hypothetical protein